MSTEVKADIALIGLAVMGQNLVLNMADNEFTVCEHNRTRTKVDHFLQNEAKGKSVSHSRRNGIKAENPAQNHSSGKSRFCCR